MRIPQCGFSIWYSRRWIERSTAIQVFVKQFRPVKTVGSSRGLIGAKHNGQVYVRLRIHRGQCAEALSDHDTVEWCPAPDAGQLQCSVFRRQVLFCFRLINVSIDSITIGLQEIFE